MKDGAHPSPFSALFCPDAERFPLIAGLTESVLEWERVGHMMAKPRFDIMTFW